MLRDWEQFKLKIKKDTKNLHKANSKLILGMFLGLIWTIRTEDLGWAS